MDKQSDGKQGQINSHKTRFNWKEGDIEIDEEDNEDQSLDPREEFKKVLGEDSSVDETGFPNGQTL